MAWEWLDDLLVVVSRAGDNAEQVAQFLNAASTRDFAAVLSVSNGVFTVNSVQRSELSKVFKNKRVISVFDGSPFTRGVITALGWLGMKITSYSLDNLEKATVDACPEKRNASEVMASVKRCGAACGFKF